MATVSTWSVTNCRSLYTDSTKRTGPAVLISILGPLYGLGWLHQARYKWPAPSPLLFLLPLHTFQPKPVYFKIDGLWFQRLARAVVKVNKALVGQLTVTLACRPADTDSGLSASWHWLWLVGDNEAPPWQVSSCSSGDTGLLGSERMVSIVCIWTLACWAQYVWYDRYRLLDTKMDRLLDTKMAVPTTVFSRLSMADWKKKKKKRKSTEELPSQFVFGFCCCFSPIDRVPGGSAGHPC